MDTVLTIIKPEDRDPYGQYAILPGHTHSHQFSIPMFGHAVLKLAHILPNSQDFSLCMWITTRPLDGLVLREGFGHFRPVRRVDTFTIYDSYLKQDMNDKRLFLDSGKTYYLNVKDLQNRKNAYQCEICDMPPPPPKPCPDAIPLCQAHYPNHCDCFRLPRPHEDRCCPPIPPITP